MNNIILDKKCSQAFQDKFVADIIGQNGTYIEIGAHLPKRRSNTYNLEVFGNYKGFGIELDTDYKTHWDNQNERKNKVYWDNALTFDYNMAALENNLSNQIDYLSCDIEPPENTLNALTRIINQGFTFNVITFEHDRYQADKKYELAADEFLLDRGYKIAVYDVYYRSPEKIFETWYINKNIDFKKVSFSEWIRLKK
jgi:hypothetical protein